MRVQCNFYTVFKKLTFHSKHGAQYASTSIIPITVINFRRGMVANIKKRRSIQELIYLLHVHGIQSIEKRQTGVRVTHENVQI